MVQLESASFSVENPILSFRMAERVAAPTKMPRAKHTCIVYLHERLDNGKADGNGRFPLAKHA